MAKGSSNNTSSGSGSGGGYTYNSSGTNSQVCLSTLTLHRTI